MFARRLLTHHQGRKQSRDPADSRGADYEAPAITERLGLEKRRESLAIKSAARVRALARGPQVQSLAAGLISQTALLVSGPVLARSLGPERRGVLALCMTAILIAVQLCSLGLPLSLAYEVSALHRSSRTVWRQKMHLISGVSALSVFGCAVVLGLFTMTRAGRQVSWLEIAFASASAGCVVVQQVCMSLLQGAHRFRILSLVRIAPACVFASLVCIYYLVAPRGTLSLILQLYLGASIAASVGCVLAVRRFPDDDVAPPGSGALIRRGLRGLLGSSTPIDTLSLDQTLVGVLLTARALGIYAVANSFSNLPVLLANSLATVALPQGARLKSLEQRAAWASKTRLQAAALIVGCVVATELLIGPLVRLLFGPEFVRSITAARILAPAGGVLAFRRLQSALLQSFGAPGSASVAEGIGLLSLLMALLLLVPSFGLIGAASSVLVAGVVANGYLWHRISIAIEELRTT